MKKLGFGFMRLPVLDENDRSTVDFEAVREMVDYYMQAGFSYFDTAHRYNDEMSETALRRTLTSRYPRESYVLADKLTLNYIKKPEDMEPFFQKQLMLCGAEYFDTYLIHNLGEAWYPMAERVGAFSFLFDLKRRGLVKRIGFSFHGTPRMLEQILTQHPETEVVQLQINYLDWEDEALRAKECYEIARKHGKPVIVMEPVKGGTLVNLPREAEEILKAADSRASLASWAIRFAAGLEGVEMVLSGMSTMEQVKDNTGFMGQFIPLGEKEQELLKRAAAAIRKNTAIACTNCCYCTTECPRNLAIPQYFALYNNMKRLKNTAYMTNQPVYYANLVQNHGRASDCIRCGKCEKNCPQRLPIRELLQQVSAVFDC